MNKEFMEKAADHAADIILGSSRLGEEEELQTAYGEMLACAARLSVRSFTRDEFLETAMRAWCSVHGEENLEQKQPVWIEEQSTSL